MNSLYSNVCTRSRGRVLDNLKDYSVKALVNAVDHLGTVAYKLNDLISMQHEAVDNTQLAASAIAQVLLIDALTISGCSEHVIA